MNKTGALKVPILPHTSPQAEQPPGMKLPLHPHQLRALNRCLVIEQDGSLSGGFGDYYDYTSRGGCLADEVGTGKTATSIGLVLSGQEGNGGDTLVVAPKHLIPQWKMEVEKFATSDVLQVIVGKVSFDSGTCLRRLNVCSLFLS
jgi:SNF2 family DNA or RNA helicase